MCTLSSVSKRAGHSQLFQRAQHRPLLQPQQLRFISLTPAARMDQSVPRPACGNETVRTFTADAGSAILNFQSQPCPHGGAPAFGSLGLFGSHATNIKPQSRLPDTIDAGGVHVNGWTPTKPTDFGPNFTMSPKKSTASAPDGFQPRRAMGWVVEFNLSGTSRCDHCQQRHQLQCRAIRQVARDVNLGRTQSPH